MSWLGEQLSSLTEKITDLTKDVLTDSGANASAEDSLPQGDNMSTKQLLDLCKQKDAQIEALLSEKLSLEKSVEELDLQHQEAVDELLHLKNEAVKENVALRQELAAERENTSSKLLLQNFKENLLPTGMTIKNDSVCTISEGSDSMKDINLVNILGNIWKNFSEDTLHTFISVLKDHKHLLDSQVVDGNDSSVRNLIHRINNYVRFLRLVSENPEVFCPIIDEIATVIHFLLSNYQEPAISNSANDVNRHLDSHVTNSASFINQETNDFSVQTILSDFNLVKNLFSETPEPFICNMERHTAENSQESQTDEEDSVPDCYDIIYELKQYIIMLEMEKEDLQQEMSHLERRVQSLSTPVEMESVYIQTDECINDCSSSAASESELSNYIGLLEKEKSDLQKEISLLRSIPETCTSSGTVQAVEYGSINTTETTELRTYVDILEQEKADLQEEILDLQNKYDKPTSSVLIQTDTYTCNCNTYELEANICILEQEVSDLHEENLHLKSLINKPSSSFYTQTEDDLPKKAILYESLLSQFKKLENVLSEEENIHQKDKEDMLKKFENLNEALISKESFIKEIENEIQFLTGELKESKDVLKSKESFISEKENTIQSLKSQLGGLNEELQSKESSLNEKENAIQSMTRQLEDCRVMIFNLEKKIHSTKSVTSVESQTAENKCFCEQYETEISELKKSAEEREKEFNRKQDTLTETCNTLRESLYSARKSIAEKDAIISTAESDIEKYKFELTKYTTHYDNNDISSCSLCKKHESEIADLKMYINEKENIINSTQTELMNNINELTAKLKDTESIVNEKNVMIQTLRAELEESKNNMNHLSDNLKVVKLQHDCAKDIDTTEECHMKKVVPSCMRCKTIINGESIENDSSIEVKLLQEKLKALDLDKNQLLCVLNEKSQECSSLKAEVHKLTNIVASEKQALYKLQQDNCLLKESRDNCDPELTKEAVKNLSQIIRDKDLEIESLKLKNSTLTTLIQDVTTVPDHMQSLIEEKENLSKQINVLKADRDKIVVRYNAVDNDCRHYAAEVKKLKSDLSDQKEKFDVLEQKHFSVAQQYEEKQKSLINTQNETIALKQRVSDLEQQQVGIKEKYSELLNKFNSDSMVQLSQEEFDEKNTKIVQLISANSEKDHLIQEKDCLIHDLSQQIKTLKLEYAQQQTNLTNVQTKVEELSAKLKEQEALVEKLQSEKEALDLRFQDKASELELLKEMNERLNMNVKEKEFTIQSMTEKVSSLSHYISSDHKTSDTVDINQILADSESMFSKAQTLHKERDETLLALSQSKQENQSLRNEIQRMKSSEIHLKKELERLRSHLLEIEENYTTEALKAEEREKELRDELVEVKRRAEISNSAVVDTNQRASIQIASLQEQLSMIANQRDQALAQVSTLEDKVHQQSASVSKLQLVLEQMQRGNERKIKDTEKRYTALLENQRQMYKELEQKLQAKEMQLEETSHALEAASRLSEQLDAKEEIIANLKSELSKTESKIKSTAQEIDTIKSNTEGKVDRVVMKSLVLGYFSTPPGQKAEVIRLLARVLDFNQQEMEKAGIVVGRNVHGNEQRGGLFASIFSRLPSLSSERPEPHPEQSFSTLFVKFLEHESQPIVPMPFPAEKMAHELHSKQHPSKKSPTTQRKSLSRSNPLLLDIDSAFPTFTPVPAVEYSQSPAPSILREVLE